MLLIGKFEEVNVLRGVNEDPGVPAPICEAEAIK
jgi:hypothetical protein